MKNLILKNSSNKDITVIVCTKNCEETIEDVLLSVIKNNPSEIIMVDASSSDKTREIAKKYMTQILTDPGKGLAIARNIGIKEVKTEYIFFIGSDNVIGMNTLSKIKKYMNKAKYVGAACLTRVKQNRYNYFSRGLDMRWRMRFYEGPREVIGTPYIFKTEILKKYQFDPKMSWSDDSDLAVKLLKDGHKVGYSNIISWEIGFENLKSILFRFRMYGKSDYEYYKKYSPSWTLRRKIRSILHPLKAEFIDPIKGMKSLKGLYYLPFLFLITIYRCRGYIGFAIRKGNERPR